MAIASCPRTSALDIRSPLTPTLKRALGAGRPSHRTPRKRPLPSYTGTDQRVSLTTGSTTGGSLIIAAHMPGGEFGSGHFQEKDGDRAVQDIQDIRVGAHAVRRPEGIRSPPRDATAPCFPVRRSRYDRIDMIGGTPEKGATDNHVSRNESLLIVLACRNGSRSQARNPRGRKS